VAEREESRPSEPDLGNTSVGKQKLLFLEQ